MTNLWQHSAWFSSSHLWIRKLDSISISPAVILPVPLIPLELWLQHQLGFRLMLRKSHLHRQRKEGMPTGANCFLKTRNEDPLSLTVKNQLNQLVKSHLYQLVMSHLRTRNLDPLLLIVENHPNQLVKSHLNQLIMCHLNNQLTKSQLNPQRVCVSHQHLNQQTQVIIAVVTSPKR